MKNKGANVLKEVKLICKELSFNAGIFKGLLAESRKTKNG